MIVTDNAEWARKAKYLITQAKDDPIEFIHGAIGYNYRLTNIQAALGCAQLEKLDEYIAKKRYIADVYTESFQDIPGLIPMREAPWALSIFWIYTILINEELYEMNSRKLLRQFEDAKIQTRPLWQPVHLSPAHADNQEYKCEIAERLQREALSLPCSVGLDSTKQNKIIQLIVGKGN
jgi:perosamine synthetase